MKTLAIIAAPTVAVAGIAPVAAEPFYSATYDAARDRYCVTERTSANGRIVPMTSGPSCRAKQRWAQAGLTIEHRRAPGKVAMR